VVDKRPPPTPSCELLTHVNAPGECPGVAIGVSLLLHEILEREARTNASRIAVISGDRRLTYSQLAGRVEDLAAALVALVPHGARVAVLADNCIEYLEAYYAVPKAGMVMTVLNQRLHPSELASIIDDVSPTVVLGQSKYVEPLRELRRELTSVQHWVGIDAGGEEAFARFTTVRSGHSARIVEFPVVDPEGTAWIIYTSGTTGHPKGAMLSHEALTQTIQSTVYELGLRDGDSFLFPLPMCHIGGYLLLAIHLVGGTVLLQPRFTPNEWLETVESERPTTSVLAPTMISMILSSSELATRDISSLKWILYGASSIPGTVLAEAIARFGTDLQQGYGGTEMGGFICTLDSPSHHLAVTTSPDLLTSAGRPMHFIDVRVVDPDLHDVTVGQIGEVVVRGKQVMSGYWRNDDATKEVFRGGWLHTGDLARLDQAGHVHIVDRMNDMIVTGAENVYPREVEDVLHRHPAVLEAAVFPIPDEHWVDAVTAAVVLRAGHAVETEALIEHCRANLASYKKPRLIVFMDELPKNATGKILRREVRATVMQSVAGIPRPPE